MLSLPRMNIRLLWEAHPNQPWEAAEVDLTLEIARLLASPPFSVVASGAVGARAGMGMINASSALYLMADELFLRHGTKIKEMMGCDLQPMQFDLGNLSGVLSDWLHQIGGHGAIPAVLQKLEAIEAKSKSFQALQDAVENLEKAEFASPMDGMIYYLPLEDPIFFRHREELKPEHRAFPFFFWTQAPYVWEGVSAARIRQWHKAALARKTLAGDVPVADAVMAELDAFIQHEIREHGSGSECQMEDLPALYTAVEEWLPDAGLRNPRDKALESITKAWNARQSVISYLPDLSRVSPMEPQDSLPQVLEKAREMLDIAQQELAVAQLWTPQPQQGIMPSG
jgi:hypothetical protein